MAECYNTACPYCVDYRCRRTCTCDLRLDGEYVKVVRCKDCKHLNKEEMRCFEVEGLGYRNVAYDDFCSRGELKDEVEE